MKTHGCLQDLASGISPAGCLSTQSYCIRHCLLEETGLKTAEQATGMDQTPNESKNKTPKTWRRDARRLNSHSCVSKQN